MILCSLNSILRDIKKWLISNHKFLDREHFNSLSMQNSKKLVYRHICIVFTLFYIGWIHLHAGVNDTACGTAIGNILRSICLWAANFCPLFQEKVRMNSQDQDGWSHVGNSFRLSTIFFSARSLRRMKNDYIEKAKQIMHNVQEV